MPKWLKMVRPISLTSMPAARLWLPAQLNAFQRGRSQFQPAAVAEWKMPATCWAEAREAASAGEPVSFKETRNLVL